MRRIKDLLFSETKPSEKEIERKSGVLTLILLALLIGIVSGIAPVVFHYLIGAIKILFFGAYAQRKMIHK